MNEENVQLPTGEQPDSDLTAPPLPLAAENELVVVEAPVEAAPPQPPKKLIKPAVLALGTIAGMLVLCLLMLLILAIVLWPQISAGF